MASHTDGNLPSPAADPWTIGVVGAGQMGAGIAQLAAQRGQLVVLIDAAEDALSHARGQIENGLAKAEAKGLAAGEAHSLALNVTYSSGLAALAACDLVIEAVPESLELKHRVLQDISDAVSPSAIIASNTSSLGIAQLSESVKFPERFLGLHFFNPAPLLPLVELIPHEGTEPTLQQRAREFAEDALGKQVVVSLDRPGFIVNALLIPYICNAIALLEAGVASAEDIDAAMVAGCAHPIGPLALADLIGLDTVLAIADTLSQNSDIASVAAPSLLWEKVDLGHLGRKSGRGFFEYGNG